VAWPIDDSTGLGCSKKLPAEVDACAIKRYSDDGRSLLLSSALYLVWSMPSSRSHDDVLSAAGSAMTFSVSSLLNNVLSLHTDQTHPHEYSYLDVLNVITAERCIVPTHIDHSN